MNAKSNATAPAVAYVSTATTSFEEHPVAAVSATVPDVAVYPQQTRQTIEGFGGSFNEKGWQALSVLDDATRRDVLRRLFDPLEGLGFTVCRVPIGASDYALDRYTLNKTAGDFAMKAFSIERDRGCLIPYIKAAMAIQPRLRLWASDWTPPTWMKDNRSFDSGAFLEDPQMYDAYALYLLRFIQSYRAAGLPIESVAVQNEPGTLTHYPSCDWTPVQYLTFIKRHLGPLFRSEGLVDAIMLGTFNQPQLVSHALTVLTDPEARQLVSLAGLQWYALAIVDQVRRAAPGLTIWQTETDCGNWFWLPGHDPDKPQNDIVYAGYTWERMRDWLRAGVTVYELWNMVLDPLGKNIDSQRPWSQNCPITIDAKSGAVRYTPMFHAVGSFSRYVPPGSRMVETEGGFTDALAFLDPAGRIVVVLYNQKIEAVRITVRVRGIVYGVDMPPRSFASLVVDAR